MVLTNGCTLSLHRSIEVVIDELQSSSKIVYEKERPGDIKHSLASIEETQKLLHFIPEYDLAKGLKETIKYYLNNKT